jgi:2-keto-4-pentenoate hydratase/2-oxohepta-3-ene-1,7-dioic acid hydratase in catechol pathway
MDKIICIGKNYQDHAAEMQEVQPTEPIVFFKPPSCGYELKNNESIALPFYRGEIHHEIEVVVKLYKKNVIGIALGLDLTLRERQKECKRSGHPWEIAKSFSKSALVTPFIAVRDFPQWEESPFTLKVNGMLKQSGTLKQTTHSVNQLILFLDRHFPLCDGDILFTGTPAGVGALKTNDHLELRWGPLHYEIKLKNLLPKENSNLS